MSASRRAPHLRANSPAICGVEWPCEIVSRSWRPKPPVSRGRVKGSAVRRKLHFLSESTPVPITSPVSIAAVCITVEWPVSPLLPASDEASAISVESGANSSSSSVAGASVCSFDNSMRLGEEPEEEGNDQSLEEDEQAWSNGEGETFIAECVGLPVEEEVGGEDSEGSTHQAEEESFGSNENGNPEPGESEGLKDRGLLDAATHNQEYGIGNQPEDGGHRAQTKPAGETDDFNHLLGCFREKGLLGTGDRWLGIGSKGVIDSLGDHLNCLVGPISQPF